MADFVQVHLRISFNNKLVTDSGAGDVLEDTDVCVMTPTQSWDS